MAVHTSNYGLDGWNRSGIRTRQYGGSSEGFGSEKVNYEMVQEQWCELGTEFEPLPDPSHSHSRACFCRR